MFSSNKIINRLQNSIDKYLIPETRRLLRAKGVFALGRTERSLYSVKTKNGAEMRSRKTTRDGENRFNRAIGGRGSGKFVPPSILERWIRAKNINDPEKTKEELAYLINRKITTIISNVISSLYCP